MRNGAVFALGKQEKGNGDRNGGKKRVGEERKGEDELDYSTNGLFGSCLWGIVSGESVVVRMMGDALRSVGAGMSRMASRVGLSLARTNRCGFHVQIN